jgi:hypothetical protein
MYYDSTSLQKAVAEKELQAVRLSHLKQDLEARELYLTPIGEAYKALGPNDSDRKNACKRLVEDDEVCKKLTVEIRALELSLAALASSITSVEVARRAEEWDVTRELAAALKAFAAVNPGPQAAQQSMVQAARALGARAISASPEPNMTGTMLDNTDHNDIREMGMGEMASVTQLGGYDIPF